MAKEKNYGIELLRILSMFFIVVLHVVGWGGVSGAAPYGSAQYYAAWVMLGLAYCAVNCYALISGYVGCTSRFRPAKLVSLWLSVVSIGVAVWLVFRIFRPETVAAMPLYTRFFPLLKSQYWYFTAYFGLSILSPALNAAIQNLEQKPYRLMLVLMFVAFSLMPNAVGNDLFYTHAGYSMVWLVLLYLAGGYVRRFIEVKRRGVFMGVCALVYFASIGLMALRRFFKEGQLFASGVENPAFGSDYSYTSVFVVIASFALFLLFTQIRVKRRPLQAVISFFSRATFGVYIIHTHELIWAFVLYNRFARIAALPVPLCVLASLGSAAAVFIVCALAEKLREAVFKLLCIDKLLEKIPFLK